MAKKGMKARKRGILNPFVLLAIGVGIVVLIVFFVLFVDSRTINQDTYFYETGVKIELADSAKLTRQQDGGMLLENDGKTYTMGALPVYYTAEKKVMLPSAMSIMLPNREKVAKLDYFTEIKSPESGSAMATFSNKDYVIEEGFLYNGKDTYIFIDKVTVQWGEQVIEMAPLSSAVVVYNQRIELYPYGGEPIVEQTGPVDVLASTSTGYILDMSKAIVTNAKGTEILLFSEPSMLEPYSNIE